ncbi:MAG: cytochrome c oxidase assembly protein, partial [Geodermatophilaceae bacterium]
LPLALAGHAEGARNHGIAVDSLGVHLVAVTVWVGGLGGLALLHRRLDADLVVSVRRYSTLAGWCFLLVAVTGVVNAAVNLDGWGTLGTGYGVLLLGKVVALTVLGWAGRAQRRQLAARMAATAAAGRLFGRLVSAELLVMAVAIGLGVALARTGPATVPVGTPDQQAAEALLGRPMPGPLTPLGWVTQWRLDLLWLLVSLLAAGWYLRAVLRLRRRGDSWGTGRLVSWLAGCATLIWATNAAPGVYANVLFSMHMVQHMTIAMAVPLLLALGAPVTLAVRTLPVRRDGSRGPREWLLLVVHSRLLRLLSQPIVAAVLFVGSLIVFYYSPLFDLALSTHTGHVLMTAHFLLTGYVFVWVICGPDPGPARLPYPLRLVLLMVTFVFHTFFGVTMMGNSQVLARDWFAALPRSWGSSLQTDQFLGGALAWGLGDIPVAVLFGALALAWLRSEDREARRYDRKAERDGGAELAAYNAYLSRLGTGRTPVTTTGTDRVTKTGTVRD